MADFFADRAAAGHDKLPGLERSATCGYAGAMVDSEPGDATTTEPRTRWRDGAVSAGERTLAVEAPVALVVNGSTYAVMLASPVDLDDFAIGFALTEGIVDAPSEVEAVEIVAQPEGIEARLWIAPGRAAAIADRRRHIAGPTGCGLCGIESLTEAARPPRLVTAAGPQPTPEEIVAAMASLDAAQPIGAATRAVHAAALWRRGEALLAREDVGRHNALDKLVGAVARGNVPVGQAMLLLTSRVSVEMVQKASVLGVGILVAVSAPTSLAVATARAAGMTLVAVARRDGFEVFCGEGRVLLSTPNLNRHPREGGDPSPEAAGDGSPLSRG